MSATEFHAAIKDENIEAPAESVRKFSPDVKVILMTKETEQKRASGFGARSNDASPALPTPYLWEKNSAHGKEWK